MSSNKTVVIDNKESAEAQAIDAEVAKMGGAYTDAHGRMWTVRASHHNGMHYLSYTTTIDGQSARVTGPHNGEYFAYRDWDNGRDLLSSLGNHQLANSSTSSLEDAIDWTYMAPDLAEEAVNRHINSGRTEVAIRKLEKQKSDAIATINQQHDTEVAELYRKAGVRPDTYNL